MRIKLRRDNTGEVIAWSSYDFANSAFATSILAVIFNHYYAETVSGGASGTPFSILGRTIQVPGATLFHYAVVISMFLVVITAPILGAAADYSNSKKKYLAFFCMLGCIFTGLLFFVRSGDVLSGAIFFIVANFAFAGGNVFYNGLLLNVAHPEDMGKVSGIGWGLGYLGGGLCLVLNLIMLMKPEALGFAPGSIKVHHIFPVVGIWWLLFALPLFIFVKEDGIRVVRERVNFIKAGFGRVKGTFKEVRRYKQLVRFLFAYILFNDGIETTIITASIFGAEVVGLGATEIIVFFLVVQATAFIGSILFGYLVNVVGNKNALMISIGVWSFIILWGRFIGFTGEIVREFYLLGILTGLVLGGSQSTARSLQASFTPKDKGAEFFGFFAVCGKFAAMLGPFLYGTAVLITGSLRSGILVMLIFFIAGGAILYYVNEEEGIEASGIGH